LNSPELLKSMHNRGEPLTEKERLSHHDDDEASILPWVLAGDQCFNDRADTLAAHPLRERIAEAERLAKNYAPYRGPHQRFIAELFVLAAETPAPLRQTRLANYVRRPIWAADELDDLDGRRKRERWQTLEDGARRVARLGAGVCIALDCPTKLATDKFGGRARPTHCSVHEGWRAGVRECHRNEIREALDAATGQRRRRRAARRRTA
jgi:hypothetical protein